MTATAKKTSPRKAGGASARQRGTAAAVAAMLVLAQLLAIFHFVLVSHSISPETGRLVHCKDHRSHGRQNDGGSKPYREAPEDECQVFAVMHQAATLPVSGPSVVAPLVESDPVPVPLAEDLLVSQRGLYLLAPSRSPPVSQA